MAWPTPQDYNEAIQFPQSCFSDPELKAGQAELTPLGLPRPIAGAFAAVYQIQCGQRRHAVRCFTTEVSDIQKRYSAISQHLKATALPYTVGFEYLTQGILIQGKWYPIVKMEWVPGEQLDTYIHKNLQNPAALLALATQWMQMNQTLQAANIAHGDLQHGNVLVAKGQLKLIDYDGMFVPALAGMGSHETGHRNYQSPQRDASHFGPYLDNFSAWAIYISLLALSFDASLWGKAKAGDENLLFRRADFEDPYSSQAMSLLSQHNDIRIQSLFTLFQAIFYLPPTQVPSLNPPADLVNATANGTSNGVANGASDTGSTQSGVNAGGGWIQDHLPNTQTNPASVNTPQPKTPQPAVQPVSSPPIDSSATWVLDFIATPQASKPFASSLLPPRAFLYGGALLILLLLVLPWFLLTTLVVQAQIAALATAVAITFILIWFYRRDTAVQERQNFLLLLKADDQGVALWQQNIQQQEEKKSVLKGEEAKALSLWAKQRASLQQQEGKEIGVIQRELQTKIKEFDARVKTLEKPLEQLRKSTSDNINRWTQEINQIAQQQSSALSTALQVLQKNHYDNYLSRATIAGASIHGIGPQMTANLQAAGFRTAADINWRVTNAHGIGDTKAAYLMAWRKATEQRANSTMPTALPQTQRDTIVQQFEAQRNRLQQQIQSANQHLQQEEAATKTRTAVAKQIIDSERKTAEAEVQKRIQDVKVSFATKYQEVARREQRIKDESNHKCKALDDEIATIRKSMQQHSWKTATLKRDFEPYRLLTFKAYLLSVSINRQIA